MKLGGYNKAIQAQAVTKKGKERVKNSMNLIV